MAQTRTAYRQIDDDEIDADSPLTQTLMTALRDQWYGALCNATGLQTDDERVRCPERLKHASVANKFLVTDGAGGFTLEDVPTVANPWGQGTAFAQLSAGQDTAGIGLANTGTWDDTSNMTIAFSINWSQASRGGSGNVYIQRRGNTSWTIVYQMLRTVNAIETFSGTVSGSGSNMNFNVQTLVAPAENINFNLNVVLNNLTGTITWPLVASSVGQGFGMILTVLNDE